MSTDVVHNAELERYEIRVDGRLAGHLEAFENDGVVSIPHTEIDPAYEGKGLGSQLVAGAVEDIGARQIKVSPSCPFVVHWFARHEAFSDLLV
jgi:uncharacterized protein